MSKSVDERVVEMRFDNKQFEKGIDDSIKSLQNLKKSLKTEDAAKGLKDLESTGKKFSLDSVANAVEAVTSKFSALGTFGDQVIRNLANRFDQLISKAGQVVASLSTDQIAAGWEKYEESANSVRTIMNATGLSVKEVESKMEKLMWYSDETSYSYTEMASSVAKFVNAGQGLDKAIDMAIGIANWGSSAGQGAQQVSMALYNTTQAFGKGNFELMDWRSIQNANMNTQEFQDTVIKTAEEMGYLRRMADGTLETMAGNKVDKKNFTDALSEGWFSSEVLENVLMQYSEFTDTVYESKDKFDSTAKAMEGLSEQGTDLGKKAFASAQEYRTLTDALNATKDAVSTGWMSTFKLLFGNMEQAKILWTAVGENLWEVFASGAEARNDMLSVWRNDMDGWEFINQSIYNIFDTLITLRDAAREGWQQIFPKMTAERFFEITKRIDGFFEKLSDWAHKATTINTVTTIFKGLASAVQLVKKVISALFAPLRAVKDYLSETGDGVSGVIGKFFNLFTTLNESEAVNNFITGFGDVLSKVAVGLVKAIQWIINAFKNLKTTMAPLGGFLAAAWNKIKEVFQGAIDFFRPVADKFKTAGAKINHTIENLGAGSTAKKVEGNVSFVEAKVNPLVVLFEKVKKFIEGVKSVIDKVMPYITTTLKKLWELLNATIDALTRITNEISLSDIFAGGLAGGGLKLVSSWSSMMKQISGLIGNFKEIFGEIGDAIGGMSKSLEKNVKADTLKKIAKAVLILAIAVAVLASIEPKKLLEATGAVVVMLGALTGSGGYLTKGKKGKDGAGGSTSLDPKQIVKIGTLLKKLATAILILAVALKIIASIDSEQMAAGVAAIGGLMTELVIATKILTKSTKNEKKQTEDLVKIGLGLRLLASAIKVLAKSVAILAAIDPEGLALGMAALSVMLTELVAFTKLVSGATNIGKVGFGMLELAAAITVLTLCISKLGQLPLKVLIQGLVAVGVAITGLAGALHIIPKDSAAKAAGLILLSIALEIIAHVVKKLGSMDIMSLVKGLAAIGIAVAGLAGAMRLMPSSGGVKNAAAMLIMVMALELLLPAFKVLGGMSWEAIAKGVAAMGAAVAGITVALNMMDGNVKGAAAFLIITAALQILTVSLLALSRVPIIGLVAGLSAVAVAMGLMVAVSYAIKPVSDELVIFANSMIKISAAALLFSASLLVAAIAIQKLAEVGPSAVHVFIDGIAAILMEIPRLLTTLADSLAKAIPAIVSIVSTLISGLVQIIAQNIPSIVEVVGTLVGAFITIIKDNIPVLVETILTLIVQVLTAIADRAPEIVTQIFRILVAVFDGLRTYIPVIVKDVALMLRDILDAIFEALDGLSVGSVVKALLGIGAVTAVFTALIGMAVVGLIASALLIPTAKNMNKFIDAMTPFLDKIQQVDSQSLFGAEALANTIMTITKASILDALTGWFRGGGDAMIKFGEQIAQLGPYIKQYADSITGIDGDAVLKSALAAQALAEFAHHIPKEGGLLQKITGETDLLGFVEALVELGPALKNYAASVDGLDAGVVENSINAASVISAFANNLPRHGGFVQAIIGDNSLNQFAQDLTVFGPNMMAYAQSVDGLKADVVIASAQAAEAISAMANGLPNQGGVVAWFAGDNTLSAFGDELAAFGPKFAEYGEAIANITPETVTASADAAAALFAVAQNVPNQGGVVSWFAGDNTLSQFAEGLVPFGEAMQSYAQSVTGLKVTPIVMSAKAAAAIFEVAHSIPNQGGIISWFAGDNKIGDFAEGLIPFGEAMQSYAQSVTGLKVTPIVMSAKAAAAIFEVAHSIPNQGGIISWFAGDNKIGDFAEGLKPFGKALKSFGESVTDLPGDDIIAATQVMKELFVIVDMMPNQGGIKSWFVGDNKLSVFAEELEAFAPSLRKYAEELEGVTISNITASGRALKVLFESIAEMPNQGGVVSWFTGDNTLGDIGKDLEVFGPAFASFASSLDDVGADTLIKVSMAFGTLKTLGSVLNSIPDQGGFVSWFVGDNTLGAIGKDLETFGPAYADFAKEVSKIDDLNAISVAFEGIQILANAVSSMPDQGGIKSWFSGDQSLAGLANGLPELGSALATFSTDLGTDFKVLPVMQAFGTLKHLGEALQAMPGEGGLAQWFAGETSLANIGAGLKEFGHSFSRFSYQVQDLKMEPVENAFNTIKVLAESLDTMPPSGGLTQWFTGDNSLVSVGEGMKKFGPSFVGFSLMVQNLKMEPVENAFRSIRVMAESLDTMPNQGGVVSWFQGDKSLAGIGEDLAKFGPKLKEYSDTVSGVKTAKVKASFQATKELAVALDSMPNKGGVASWFQGEKSLGSLGDDLPKYGVALYKFYVVISHINVDKVREGISLTESFVNIMSGMEGKRAAFIEWFTGDKSLSTLGKDLAAYGGYLGDFQKNVKDVKYDRLRGMVNATESIVDVVKTMEPIGGWDGFWSGEKDLSSLGYQISSLGGYFKSYVETTDGIDWDKMSTSVDVLQKFVDLGTNMQGVDFDSYYTFAESFNSLALSGTDTFISAWESGYEDIIKVGESAMSNLITGMSNKKNEVAAMASTIVTTVTNNLNGINVLHEPYNIGVNYIQGLIDGMNAKVPALDERTTWIARKRAEIMRDELGIASPSKVTHEIGEYLMEGLANGMVDGASVANNASREVSDEVLMAMTNAIASVMALMQSDGTFTPVIRPVVDLSDAEKQAGEIGGLFGKQTVAGSGFAAAAGLNRSIQNGAVLGGSSTTTTNNSAAITINVYGGHGQSAQDIANEVQKRLKQDLDRRGYAFR